MGKKTISSFFILNWNGGLQLILNEKSRFSWACGPLSSVLWILLLPLFVLEPSLTLSLDLIPGVSRKARTFCQ
jgi:hypothetical protein